MVDNVKIIGLLMSGLANTGFLQPNTITIQLPPNCFFTIQLQYNTENDFLGTIQLQYNYSISYRNSIQFTIQYNTWIWVIGRGSEWNSMLIL